MLIRAKSDESHRQSVLSAELERVLQLLLERGLNVL